MPKKQQGLIKSETRWITMIASKEGSTNIRNPEKVWYLIMYVNGIELDFAASEAGSLHLFTEAEATNRIKEFEDILKAEKTDYVAMIASKACSLIEKL